MCVPHRSAPGRMFEDPPASVGMTAAASDLADCPAVVIRRAGRNRAAAILYGATRVSDRWPPTGGRTTGLAGVTPSRTTWVDFLVRE